MGGCPPTLSTSTQSVPVSTPSLVSSMTTTSCMAPVNETSATSPPQAQCVDSTDRQRLLDQEARIVASESPFGLALAQRLQSADPLVVSKFNLPIVGEVLITNCECGCRRPRACGRARLDNNVTKWTNCLDLARARRPARPAAPPARRSSRARGGGARASVLVRLGEIRRSRVTHVASSLFSY